MKRGLIAWDKEQLPPAVFEQRLDRVRKALTERELPVLLVYSDIWRSNQGRFLTNFMPYWNRSLIVVPRDGAPVLLCGLSLRVYPWIKSVTIFEEIRPGLKLPAEWPKIGVLDLPKLPIEIRTSLGNTELVDVPSLGITEPDEAEFVMRRRAAELARKVLREHLPIAPDIGKLERELRRAGAEDLVIRARPRGNEFSISLALEYCGHWVKVTRARAPADELATLERRFRAAFENGEGYRENLAGPQPYEAGTGPIYALHVEHNGLSFGDTCAGTETL